MDINACQGSFVAGEQSEITADLEEIDSRQPDIEDNDWINYRNSDTNNGVTSAATPSNVDETVQKWAVKMGGDWSAAVTPPLVLWWISIWRIPANLFTKWTETPVR